MINSTGSPDNFWDTPIPRKEALVKIALAPLAVVAFFEIACAKSGSSTPILGSPTPDIPTPPMETLQSLAEKELTEAYRLFTSTYVQESSTVKLPDGSKALKVIGGDNLKSSFVTSQAVGDGLIFTAIAKDKNGFDRILAYSQAKPDSYNPALMNIEQDNTETNISNRDPGSNQYEAYIPAELSLVDALLRAYKTWEKNDTKQLPYKNLTLLGSMLYNRVHISQLMDMEMDTTLTMFYLESQIIQNFNQEHNQIIHHIR